MNYRLTADGGSTKIHWALTDQNRCVAKEFFSTGINPLTVPEDSIVSTLQQEVLPNVAGVTIERIGFYGAGCRDIACETMLKALALVFNGCKEITVDSDIVGACKALLGNRAGVACILGTGANSCFYDGNAITEKTTSLGYILGDEGSGAWLGKKLLAAMLRHAMPIDLEEQFKDKYHLSTEEIIRCIYRPSDGGMPANRFLASFAPFLSENICRGEIRAIVEDGFKLFFQNNVMPYFLTPGREALTVNCVGSVAAAFANVLREVASGIGINVGIIMKSPMTGLLIHDL